MSAAFQSKTEPSIKAPHSFFIGGQWQKPATSGRLSVISPVTEQVVMTFAEAAPADVDRAVAAAREAFDRGPWPRMTPAERGAKLLKVAELLRARQPELAQLWTTQVGAAISFTKYVSGQPADLFEYYGKLIQSYPLVDERKRDNGGLVRVVKEPIGVVAAITPWNAPLVLLCYKVAAGLGGRLHDRREAGARDAGRRVHPRRVHRGRGLAARRVQRDSGRPRDGRLSRSPSRHRQDQLHGLHGRGPAHRGRRRGAVRAHELRARRQVGRDRARRRGRRPGAEEPRAVLDADHGPSLLLADARARAREAQERAARRVRRRREEP